MEDNDNENKKILINGTNNRYLIKRANRVVEVPKQRAIVSKYGLNIENMNYENQLKILNEIENKINNNNNNNNIEKDIIIKEIEKKIYNYKQQDLLKKKFNENSFITFDSIIKKLNECRLKCYYCNCEMFILYENVREMSQWSVDRIDNDKGHNLDNYVLSCLKCNINRRKKSSDKFLFTKKLNISKIDANP